MKNIIDNSAGPTGVLGLIVAKLPETPNEWLVCLSTILVAFQLVHWGWRFIRWAYRGYK